jgi:predicted nucleotide-binding protein (sugar kinase/HSP70/actin superfamily)
MNLVKKLNKLGVGIITEEFIDEASIADKTTELFKRPFWTFAKNAYGASTYLAENKKINGIVYISSFACGIDSVVIDLIKQKVKDFPFLVLKVDEHTGESGFDTRIEAFVDMLERK